MKNSTAEKLRQIPAGYLIAGVDAHKMKHAVVLRTQDAVVHSRFKVNNSREGFNELLERTRRGIGVARARGVIFAIEAGGNYWQPLAYFLDGNGVPFRMVNPFTLKRRREGDDVDRRKNDYHDAETAAELLRTGTFTESRLAEGEYAELRATYHGYHRLSEEISQVSNLLGSLLDGVFPEFCRVFRDIDSKTALAVLEAYPLPRMMAAMRGAEFRDAMLERYKGKRITRKKLAAIHEAACSSIGMLAGSTAVSHEILMLVQRLRLLHCQKEKVVSYLEGLVESMPESRYLLSVDGIGHITVAGLLGELGPVRNYRNAKQLVKMAGINPIQSESAGKRGSRTPMSKKGRPMLRHCLWEACTGLLRHNEQFKSWFNRLVARPVLSHPLNKREARGAMCRKLLHLAFALVKNSTDYRREEMVSATV
ncbi:MAG: IS110 family transposase [Chloroflexi bacterium]|nr:IS110 family transposase [Chloroflexota bacterium]